MTIDAEALAKLAEELKCPLCIDILKPPCARPACCHYLCSSCLTDLLKNRQECPICNGPLRRRDIRGDARIDRIATLVARLQTIEGLNPEALIEYQPLQPADQNAFRRRGSGAQPKRSSGGGRSASRRRSTDGDAQPADGGRADAEAGQEADGLEREPRAAAARPPKRAHAAGIKRGAAPADAAAAGGGPFEPPAAQSEAAATDAPLTFKRMKRQKAAEGKPEAEHEPRPEQKSEVEGPQSAKQQAAERQQTAGQPEQKQQARRPQPAQQPARQQLQAAARLYAAKNGRRVSEPKLDPYDFHSSGSKPSAPQAVLVAAPAASGAAAAAADSPSAAPPTAFPPAGHPAAREPARAAKRPRSTAAERPAAAAMASDRGSSEDTAAAASGRRIPGRLVPWACGACTFENPASAHECAMCTAPRPKQRSPPPPEAQPSQQTSIAAAAAPKSSKAAKRPAKRRAAEPAANDDAARPAAPAAAPAATGGPSRSRKPATAKPGAGMVLVPSGMDTAGKEQLAAFARAIGARMAPRNKWSDSVTHVVCGVATPDGTPRRTLTVLLGVLSGRWVVSTSWLPPPGSTRIADEEEHEIEGGPQLGRLSRSAGGGPLLSGYEIHLAGHFGRREDFTRLIKAAGAKLLARPPADDGSTAKRSTEATICLYDEDSCSWGKGERQQRRHVWHVSSKWLSDTAFAYTVAPLEEYVVDSR